MLMLTQVEIDRINKMILLYFVVSKQKPTRPTTKTSTNRFRFDILRFIEPEKISIENEMYT